MSRDSALLKLELLSHGITYSPEFLRSFGTMDSLLEKRRAYGTGDAILFDRGTRVPQEIVLEGGVVCAVNFSSSSPWQLSFDGTTPYVGDSMSSFEVTFPLRPAFYGERISTGERVEQIVTLYGTGTLGIFSVGHCYYFDDARECKFCSLGSARTHESDHAMKVQRDKAKEAVGLAVAREPQRIRHVLLNGGTARNYDKAFLNMVAVLEAALAADGAAHLEGHMISMPPFDFSLFRTLTRSRATLALSLEVWDAELFEEICPGKAEDYGRDRFLAAYDAAVEALGRGNVYAGFVAGLEPTASLIEGMYALAERGAVPAVAVFHPDAGSVYADRPRPTVDELKEVGAHMSKIYAANAFRPLIAGSGRNSLDTEAYQQYLA